MKQYVCPRQKSSMNTQILSNASNLFLTHYAWDFIKQLRKHASFTSTDTKNGTQDSWEMFTMPNVECHL